MFYFANFQAKLEMYCAMTLKQRVNRRKIFVILCSIPQVCDRCWVEFL